MRSATGQRPTDSGIGAVIAGRSVAAVGAQCTIASDSVLPGREGIPARFLSVVIGHDTVLALVEGDHIDMIVIDDRRLRTPDWLGVGSTLGHLLRLTDLSGVFSETDFICTRRLAAVSASRFALMA